MPDTSSVRIGRAVAPRVSSSRCPTRESKFRLRVKWFKTGRNFFHRDSFHPSASKTGAGAEDDSESGMLCPESLNANKIDLTPLLQAPKAGRSEADFRSNDLLPRPYAAFLRVTCMPALVARVISISRLNLSHLPLIKSETLD